MNISKNLINKQKIANGDPQEWQNLFDQYYRILSEHANHIVKDIHLANDIAEIIFLKLWQQRTTVPQIGFLKAYLIRAVRNKALT